MAARFKNLLIRLLDKEFGNRIGTAEDAVDNIEDNLRDPSIPPTEPETFPTQMRWKDLWSQKEYYPHDVVRDGEWTMAANKTTTDRPAPQPVGVPDWIGEHPDAPAWISDSDTAAISITGQRYTFAQGGFLAGFRIWFPVADPLQLYEVWQIEGPQTILPIFSRLFGPAAVTAAGWADVAIPASIIASGTEWDLLVVAQSPAIPITDSAPWQYKRQNGNSSSGEANHQNNNTTLSIHHTDSDSNDQQALLESVGAGDTISAGGITWTVTSFVQLANNVNFEVTPATRAQEGDYTFSFNILVDGLCPSVRIQDHYLAAPPTLFAQVQGLKGLDALANVVTNQNAYGVDLFYTIAQISPDWDLVALSEGVAATGLPEDIKFRRDSTQIDITTQADDPITPTNWVTYADFDMDFEQEVNYELHQRLIWTMDVSNRQAYFRTLVNDSPTTPGEFQRVELADAANREFHVDIDVSDIGITAPAPVTINLKFQALVSAGGNPTLTIFDNYFLIRSLPSAVEVP